MTGAAEERVLRTIGLLFGLAGSVFGLLTLPPILDQLTRTPIPWTAAALAATLAPPIVLGIAAPWARIRTIRVLGIVVALGNLLTLLTVVPVTGPGATASESPWSLQLTAVGTTGAALGLPVGLVALDVVLTGALVLVDRWATSTAPLGLIPLQDCLYATLFCAVFAGLAVGSLHAARAVDRATSDAFAAVRSARDQRLHADERARVSGLVHDHVLTTLLVAARNPEPSDRVASDAADALVRLRRASGEAEDDDPLEPEAFLDRLRAQVTATAPLAVVSVEGDRLQRLPPAAAEALLGAAGEALRNVRRHAGPEAGVEVHVVLEDGCVEVVVVDDGIGFVRSEVPADRLGIAASIESRMRGIGGHAAVRSAPGRGTAVRVRWEDR